MTGKPPVGPDVTNSDPSSVDAINPHISLTKTPNPTIYSLAGQVISYSLVATNDGDVTLTNVQITDPKLGLLTCSPTQPATLAVNSKLTCTGSYTIQPADIKTDRTGTVVNTASVSGTPPVGPGVTATATAAVKQTTGQITPTATTCQQFQSNTALDLNEELYDEKNGMINSVAPGVFFYYSLLTAPSASFTVGVTESKQPSTLWPWINIQDLGQVILWDNTCTKVQTVTPTYSNGQVTLAVTGATAGAPYILIFIPGRRDHS